MEILLSRVALADALALAVQVASRRTTLPILSNVLLRAMGTKVVIAATDSTTTVSSEIDCEIKEGGSLALNGANLTAAVKSFEGDSVHIKRTDEHSAEVQSGRPKFKLAGLPAKDFPKIPDHREVAFSQIQAKAFLDILQRTEYAASTDPQRASLYGVHFQCDGETAMACAGDNSGMSWLTRPFAGPKVKGVLLPRQAVKDIVALLGEQEAVGFAVTKGYVFVQAGTTILAAQPAGVEWPLDVLKEIPRKVSSKTAIAPRKALISAFKRCAIVTTGTRRAARLELRPGELVVTAEDSANGTVRDEIPAQCTVDSFGILGGVKIWIDHLEALDGDEVEIGCQGLLDHVVFRQPGDETAKTVLMPMRDE